MLAVADPVAANTGFASPLLAVYYHFGCAPGMVEKMGLRFVRRDEVWLQLWEAVIANAAVVKWCVVCGVSGGGAQIRHLQLSRQVTIWGLESESRVESSPNKPGDKEKVIKTGLVSSLEKQSTGYLASKLFFATWTRDSQ